MRSIPDPDKNKQTIPWFKHKAGMRNHRKVKVLRADFGLEGYAVWSYILEFFCDTDGLRFSSDPLELRLLAGDIGIASDRLIQIIDLCLDLKLLEKDSEGYYYSPSFHDEQAWYFAKKEYERTRYAESKAPKKSKKSPSKKVESPDFESITEEPPKSRLSAESKILLAEKDILSTESDKIEIEIEIEIENNTLSPITGITRAREVFGEPKPERESVLNSEVEGFLTGLSSSHVEFADAWNSWVRHREKQGRQMTPEIQIEDLRFLKAQPNPVECIRFNIRKGWTALYPAKPDQYQAPVVTNLVKKQKPQIVENIEVASRETVKKAADLARNLIRGGPTSETA